MKSEFSEFSYGFAFTYELVNALPGISAAPLFPSLRAEAQLGFDVRLNYPGLPIFFQYKLSDCLIRTNSSYWSNYRVPYYRLNITPLRTSRQHNILKQLADLETDVFYAAPLFYTMLEFNNHYLESQVTNRSAWIPLEELPCLDDNEDHCVTFTTPNNLSWHTDEHNLEGKILEGNFSAEHFYSDIEARFNQNDLRQIDRTYFAELRDKLIVILNQNEIEIAGGFQTRNIRDDANEVIRDIGYLLTTYFSLEMVIFQRNSPESP